MNVKLTHRALKDLDRLTPSRRLQVLQRLERLEEAPLPDGFQIKRIEGYPQGDLYRLRVGSYRVLYVIEANTVYILRVIPRQDLIKAIRQLRESG